MCRMSAARVMLPASTIRTNENRRRVSMRGHPSELRRDIPTIPIEPFNRRTGVRSATIDVRYRPRRTPVLTASTEFVRSVRITAKVHGNCTRSSHIRPLLEGTDDNQDRSRRRPRRGFRRLDDGRRRRLLDVADFRQHRLRIPCRRSPDHGRDRPRLRRPRDRHRRAPQLPGPRRLRPSRDGPDSQTRSAPTSSTKSAHSTPSPPRTAPRCRTSHRTAGSGIWSPTRRTTPAPSSMRCSRSTRR